MIPINSSRFTPELRVTTFYFFQALSVGASNAFAGIWFTTRGMTPEQIGVINAGPVAVLLALSLTIGRIADRANDWRQVIIIGALASALFPLGLFFVAGFWGILIFWTLSVSTQWGITTVADAAAMRMSRRRSVDFGTFRAWGTIGYLSAILIAGHLLNGFGSWLFLPLFAGLAMMRGVASLALPKLRAGDEEKASKRGANQLRHALKPWFVLPLAGWALVYSTHSILNAFQGLLWKEQGIPSDTIGLLIALGALSETAMFFAFKRFGFRFSARSLILVSCGVSVIRWVAMSYAPGVEILIGLQLLHSITYALGFIACVNFIANGTTEDIAAEAQSFFVVLQLAIAIPVVLTFGSLAGTWGAEAYLVSAVVAAVGALLVWISFWLERPKG